jgi:hypothetical protein
MFSQAFYEGSPNTNILFCMVILHVIWTESCVECLIGHASLHHLTGKYNDTKSYMHATQCILWELVTWQRFFLMGSDHAKYMYSTIIIQGTGDDADIDPLDLF